MMKLKIKFDTGSLKKAVDDYTQSINKELESVGEQSVEYAKEYGNYHDVTGNLRASNQYEVTNGTLKIQNTAEYAADVEARGSDVITGAFLNAEKLLREVGLKEK